MPTFRQHPDRRTALAAGAGLLAATRLAAQPKDAKPPLVEGYTNQVSYAPGEELKLHVSSAAERYDVEIARLGAKREVVWSKKGVPGKVHPIPANASSHGCRWPATLTIPVPENWRSGYYTVKLGEKNRDAYFIVRPKVPASKILIQLSTNTYNAYTNWNGYSLYAYHARHKAQGRRVSFDRPQYSQFPTWEQPFVAWAESNGYALDYCANSDLEFHPELLEHYKLVLSVGHDEYWSSPMRDHLERYIGGGGNVAFFSGNTCCWQVRSEESGRALACWKQNFGDDPYYASGNHKLLSTLWSHYLVGRPENSLTGVGFLWGGYRKSHGQYMTDPAEYTVHRPDHWLFAGTNLKRGNVFGDKDTIVGYECDGCELVWKDGLPSPTGKDGTPANFEVLATCPTRWHPDDCEWYEKWEKGRVGNAVLGSYMRGGTVVTVGSTDWAHGLRGKDKVVERITRNVLDKLG
ncbi:MAG: hypothetical protein KF873_06800 [Gemmataceae bacterium]|nr:hypothetical protein [Gemmataceae bacterium]